MTYSPAVLAMIHTCLRDLAHGCSRVLPIVGVVGLFGCRGTPAETMPVEVPRVANLHAFAQLYGVVRWFHPSDAAAAVDWERFAVDGARRVVDAPTAAVLRSRLTELFAPFAPTVHLVAGNEVFPEEPALHPVTTDGLEVVAWQHDGFGDSVAPTGYKSKRTHRDRVVAVGGLVNAALSQSIDAVRLRGATIRLRGKMRTAGRALGRMWLRVDRGDVRGFYETMAIRPVSSTAWTAAEIVGTVDRDATRVAFGTIMAGGGTTWYDDVELSVRAKNGSWESIAVPDGGFEAADPSAAWNGGMGLTAGSQPNVGWSITVDRENPAAGTSSLRVERETKVLTEDLFEFRPQPGETVDVELGSGLRARVPIALYSKDGRTIGDDVSRARQAQAGSPTVIAGFDASAGIADLIVAWNVFEHFWSYWDVVDVDWRGELDRALADALDDRTVDDHARTLRRLTVAAPDGHTRPTCPGETQLGFPPFSTELVEGQVVVTNSADPQVQRGDVIVTMDEVAATQRLAMEVAYVSGSPQYRTVIGLRRLGRGLLTAKLTLRVRRAGTELRVVSDRIDRAVEEAPSRAPIEVFGDGVYYVDLSRATLADIAAAMERLAVAPGVVFDVRNRPLGNQTVLSHLLTIPDDALPWSSPRVIRPSSGSRPAGWSAGGWNLSVQQPHIRGKVAFVTGPTAASYPESVMALVAHYKLGAIVGAATAGANGDIAVLLLPTGCDMWMTGRRTTKPDGSRFHLLGIQPTIPAGRTIAGVAAGRDEVLETALSHVRGTR